MQYFTLGLRKHNYNSVLCNYCTVRGWAEGLTLPWLSVSYNRSLACFVNNRNTVIHPLIPGVIYDLRTMVSVLRRGNYAQTTVDHHLFRLQSRPRCIEFTVYRIQYVLRDYVRDG